MESKAPIIKMSRYVLKTCLLLFPNLKYGFPRTSYTNASQKENANMHFSMETETQSNIYIYIIVYLTLSENYLVLQMFIYACLYQQVLKELDKCINLVPGYSGTRLR